MSECSKNKAKVHYSSKFVWCMSSPQSFQIKLIKNEVYHEDQKEMPYAYVTCIEFHYFTLCSIRWLNTKRISFQEYYIYLEIAFRACNYFSYKTFKVLVSIKSVIGWEYVVSVIKQGLLIFSQKLIRGLQENWILINFIHNKIVKHK